MKKTVIVVISVLFITIFSISFLTKSVDVLSEGLVFPCEKTVIIDAGHGGFDPGASAIDGTLEKDLNLQISKKINEILLLNGYETVMLRDTDKSLEESGHKLSKKKSDINFRLNTARKYPNAIFLSIHQNSYRQKSSHGAQVFYGVKSDKSKRLAQILQSNLEELLQKDNTRQIKKSQKNLYIMTNMENTGVLLECGFITNPNDLELLKNDEYQQKFAFVVFLSLEDFFNESKEL